MSYFDTMDWEKIRHDVVHDREKGIGGVKKGKLVVQNMTEEMTEAGMRNQKVMALKLKAYTQMTALGARVYYLMGTRSENPTQDATIKDIVVQLRRSEAQIDALVSKTAKTGRHGDE